MEWLHFSFVLILQVFCEDINLFVVLAQGLDHYRGVTLFFPEAVTQS